MRPVSDGDRELLLEIVERRRPELVPSVADVGDRPVSGRTLEQLRLAVVDEACETPRTSTNARRILELEDLLTGLTSAPAKTTPRRRAR